MKIKVQFVLLCLLLPVSAWPATWFVRPGVFNGQDSAGQPIVRAGVYGAQNGTNYANAWNGLCSVVWGTSGVKDGDTLYVCGTHIYSFTNDTYFTSQTKTACVPGTTVRMDWTADPGLVFVGSLDNRPANVWSGPDTNGVYWSVQGPLNGTQYPISFQVEGTNITRLNLKTNATWAGDLGSAAFINGTNYVKTLTGAAPSTNLAISGGGWRFWIDSKTNVTFRACRFMGGSPVVTDQNTKYITFDGGTFLQGVSFWLPPGLDHWTFANCEIGYAPVGIYTYLTTGAASGANFLTVSNCYIHDCDTTNYPHGDGHALGIQASSFCLLTHNRLERTGAAIEFYTTHLPMSNNIVSYNSIRDVHMCSVTMGEGIGVGGINTTEAGLRTGFEIYGNVIWNTEGYGIDSNNRDYMEVYNNTVYNADRGINFAVLTNSASGMVQNNLIAGTRSQKVIWISGVTPSTTNLLVDYNLYASNATSSVVYVNTTLPHDQHSVYAQPLFVSTAPTNAADFRLTRASKAIGAGTAVGLPQDFDGIAIPTNTPPDIGAFQFLSASSSFSAPAGLHIVSQ